MMLMHSYINNKKRLKATFLYLMAVIWLPWSVKAQEAVHAHDVTGVVAEASDGSPLSGINVAIPGYSATITDTLGKFKIKVPDYRSALYISGQNYQTKLIALKGRHTVKVLLYAEPFNSFYDVATLPFGTKIKAHIPYAITSLNMHDKWGRSVTESTGDYLQGKVAGLDVTRRSGTPGIGANMFLRGFNSLYATNQPLIVVDGMIYDNNQYGNSLITGYMNNPLSDIDIRDIDNITVLKDGTSTYGTRGANGVILITTARAKDLATKIDFAVYGGYNYMPKEIPLMNAGDYRIYLSDLLQSEGLSADSIQAKPYMNDAPNPNYYTYHNNTDWQRWVMHNSYDQNYYLKVTGGDDIARYALSLGYLKNRGIIDNTGLTRSQTRFNGDLNLSKRLKASVNLSYVSNTQSLKNMGIAPQTDPLYLALVKSPLLSVYVRDEQGIASPNLSGYDIFNMSNPVSIINNMEGNNKDYRFTGSVSFKYQLSNSINLSTLLGITFDKARENIFIPQAGVLPDTLVKAVALNQSGSSVRRLYSLYNDTRFTYDRTFDHIHHLTANVGFRYNSNQSQNEFGYDYNSATDEFRTVSEGDPSLRETGGNLGKWNWLNAYLNADYALMNKYFFSFNMAADGSSRFGKDAPDGFSLAGNKWAIMPSLAAAWLISSENFMANVNFIDLLKLRASGSRVGNDDIGNYSARQYYVTQSLLGMQGLVRGNIANPALEWETVYKGDIGLDAAFLNERLKLSLDLYLNKSFNMIVPDSISTPTGFQYVLVNGASMKTHGFEAAISGRITNGSLKWDMSLNLATWQNKVTKLPNGQIMTSYAGATYLTEVGHPANLFYGYKTDGVFASSAAAQQSELSYENASGEKIPFQAGDIHFVDVNGDKVINDQDRQIIGNPNPALTGGFENNLSWKHWGLDVLFTCSLGNDIYNYTRQQLESMSGYENQTLAVENRWKADGQVTSIPRASWGDPSGNARFSTRWIEDGSYLRLRSVSLSYNLPVNTNTLRYIDIYASGNNLYTWTHYLGYDPEFSASGSLFTQGIDLGLEPVFRSVQVGIRFGF